MIVVAVMLLGMMGEPIGPDYYPLKTRNIKFPIQYTTDRKLIREVQLYVSRNRENTWSQVGSVAPDKDFFLYTAPADGVYWFKMQLVDVKGNRDPADIMRGPPDLKVLIDTTAPLIRITNTRRHGEEIVIEWTVEEKFPNGATTKVHFRPSDNTDGWREVLLPTNSRTGVMFPSGTTDGITVRITAVDRAGNRTEVTKEFPAVGVSAAIPGKLVTPLASDDEHSGIVQAGATDATHTSRIRRAVLREPSGLQERPQTEGHKARQKSTGAESAGCVESWLFR